MIISEKQIMQLMAVTNHYIELIALIQQEGINMDAPEHHQYQAIRLLRVISDQQSEELKVVE